MRFKKEMDQSSRRYYGLKQILCSQKHQHEVTKTPRKEPETEKNQTPPSSADWTDGEQEYIDKKESIEEEEDKHFSIFGFSAPF